MSYYHGGGGGGRRHGGYRDDRRREPREHHYPAPERPETRLRNAIVKFGDDVDRDPQDEMPRLLSFIRSNLITHSAAVAEGFRIAIVEQPYKIPYYALLFASVVTPPSLADDAAGSAEGQAAKQLLDDFFKGFQSYLDKLAWREIRLCIHFFAHLTLASLISPQSMLALLQSFITVLDEPGVSHYRARSSALSAGEGLLRAGGVLHPHASDATAGIITALKAFSTSFGDEKALVSPVVLLHAQEMDAIDWKESISCLVNALETQQSNNFASPPASLPRIMDQFPQPAGQPYDLPFVLVPPEAIEMDDGLAGGAPSIGAGDGDVDGTKSKPPAKQEYPYAYLSLFPEDITPSDSTPAGYLIRSCILDMLDIFEINRKECARILLELPRWWESSTFKGGAKRVKAEDEENEDEEDDSVGEIMGWSLENMLVETILSTAFLIPTSPHIPIYYYALITDLCKASPTTVGPAVGKSIRKLYKLVGEGLEVEVQRRFADWFAIHMSNFAFNWVWKEWIPDLSLSPAHPRRDFIRRSIQLEIRLAYYDRIKGSLPEDFHTPEAEAIPQEAPGPSYEYENPDHPYFEPADALLSLIRGRSKADVVVEYAETMRHTIAESSNLPPSHAASIVRSIAVQNILFTGSRSFSHFLNAIERYLPLLRTLSNPSADVSPSPGEARAEILDNVVKFWARNTQMIGIVFDKLMQYQIVDPVDIVGWAFKHGDPGRGDADADAGVAGNGGLGAQQWELMKAALDKAAGRVEIAKGKVAAVKKVEEDTKSKAKAKAAGIGGNDDGMDVEVSADVEDSTQSPALANALKAHATLTRDQKTALARALDGFVLALGSSSSPGASVLNQESWDGRGNWGQDEWRSWETWGWYRQFCRAYMLQLKVYINTLEAVSLSKLEASEGIDVEAAQLIKKVWHVALGTEA